MTNIGFTREQKLELLEKIIPVLDENCKKKGVNLVDLLTSKETLSRKTIIISEYLGTGNALNPAEVNYIIQRYEKNDYAPELIYLKKQFESK